MANWTPPRSVLLSHLLDDVVGTEEMVRIRQDYCRISDVIESTKDSANDNMYYTGSKAEGLHLPGSDHDFMMDINNRANLLIIQKMQDAPTATHRNVFCMQTENVPPCFVMLKSANQLQHGPLLDACQLIDNAMYLSSYLLVHNEESEMKKNTNDQKIARQGPSIERWTPYMDTSKSGFDTVPSIHCPFWPDSAKEWRTRPRQFAWPSPSNIRSIVDFGFHLVPVGHPHSDRNMMEWRISFSVAERTLVWSFNHVQIQCYAVMKIILKEFINPNCSPDNRVLCSYFIKTFLFWNNEETDPSFWCQKNLRECVMFLLSGFRECILRGSLRHYFIPGFNLLSVKVTAVARREILEIFEIILQSDISIMKECNTLIIIWDQFVNTESDIGNCVLKQKRNLLKYDAYLLDTIRSILSDISSINKPDLISTIDQFVSRIFQNVQTTSIMSFVVQITLFLLSNKVVGNYRANIGNKTLYRPCRYLTLNTYGFDISTNRLWYAMIMTMRGDYSSSLRVLDNVLSSIPPYALYCSIDVGCVSNETKNWYVDAISSEDNPVTERARKAWMFDLVIMPVDMGMVPSAIQTELTHCDEEYGVHLSPFVCVYYLMFFNYHALRQYENRDRVLQQLIETINNPEQCGRLTWFSYNITGHCLWYTGLCEQARDMFMRSYLFTSDGPHHRFNSARFYLQCLQLWRKNPLMKVRNYLP